MPSATPMLTAALSLASRGLRVHPLQVRGKHPISPHGVLDATHDKDQIVQWWTQTPNANIGIATGSGVVVIDLDSDNAESTLLALEAEHGSLPVTRVAETGRGTHWYFRVPDGVIVKNRVKLAPDIDIRGDGGFVVAPPSVHENGASYRWRFDQQTAALPEAWITLLQAPAERPPIDLGDDSPIPIGQQNDEIFRRVSKLRGQGVDVETARIYVRGLSIPNDPERDPWTDADLDGIVERVYAAYEAGERPAAVRQTTTRATQAPLDPTTAHDGLEFANTVKTKRVEWLWRGRIPLGYVTILDGMPGTGKSFLTLDLAARVTRGDLMPDGTRGLGEPAGVLVWSVEDGMDDVIVPRLIGCNAALERFAGRSAAPTDHSLSFADFDLLRSDIEHTRARLVVIDPMSAYLGKADGHKDQDVRGALIPIQRLAKEFNISIVLVRHLNKQLGADAVSRGGGSIGIIGLARAGLLAARDSDEPGAPVVLATHKTNLAAFPPSSLTYKIVERDDDPDQATLLWGDTSSKTANDLVAMPDAPQSAIEEAMTWLRLHLSYGPVATKQLDGEARDEGFAPITVRRAKERLGVVSEAAAGSMPAKWICYLPTSESSRAGVQKNDQDTVNDDQDTVKEPWDEQD